MLIFCRFTPPTFKVVKNSNKHLRECANKVIVCSNIYINSRTNFKIFRYLWLTIQEIISPRVAIFLNRMTKFSHFYGFCHRNMLLRLTKIAKKYTFTPLFFYNKHLSPKTNNMHVVAAYLMCIHIFAKIVCHVGGHLGFLGPHHDSSQSPSILHLRYVSNHLWNNFLWTSHAHRHPLRDCITSPETDDQN